jgi:predicted acetyltransferase
MPELLPPTVELRRSFVAAIREYQASHAAAPSHVVALDPDRLTQPRDFADYVGRLLARQYEDTPRPPGWVPDTTLWWADGQEFLGRLQIRHRLTPQLDEVGGHIGYDVRPSARRRGHATAMLRAGLSVARRLGIERALLTCDHNNVGSRKVIEANGGAYIDRRGDKLRFWVPTDLG